MAIPSTLFIMGLINCPLAYQIYSDVQKLWTFRRQFRRTRRHGDKIMIVGIVGSKFPISNGKFSNLLVNYRAKRTYVYFEIPAVLGSWNQHFRAMGAQHSPVAGPVSPGQKYPCPFGTMRKPFLAESKGRITIAPPTTIFLMDSPGTDEIPDEINIGLSEKTKYFFPEQSIVEDTDMKKVVDHFIRNHKKLSVFGKMNGGKLDAEYFGPEQKIVGEISRLYSGYSPGRVYLCSFLLLVANGIYAMDLMKCC